MDSITQGKTLQTSVPSIYRKETRDQQEIPHLKTDTKDPEGRVHELEKPEWQDRLRKLMQWRRQARVAQAENRSQMAIDEDYYDGIQLEAEELHVLVERNQPVEVFNVTKNVINWILGTEVKSRVDYRILPRTKSSAESAKAKTKLFKYVSDVSRAEFHRSQAFQESIKAGVGWLECGVRNNGDEPIYVRSERWRNMWFDHLGLEADCSDWRYVVREKWVDLDIAQAMFPERKDSLKVVSEGVNSLYPYLPDDIVITDNASEFDIESDLDALFGGPFDGSRERVKIVEMPYRMPSNEKLLRMRDEDTPYGALDGAIYRKGQADHDYLVKGGYFSTFDAYVLTVRMAMWTGGTYLQDILTPYNHNRFPFIPVFCYRRKRDNMPYGVIRDIRDPQSDLNKRRSKSLFLLTANQVVAEANVVDDKIEFMNELNRPDGFAETKTGALQGNKIQLQRSFNIGLADAHLKMAQDDIDFIHTNAGVQYEMEGRTKKDLSGKAINALNAQGQTSQGVPFDNYYFAFQLAGEVINSLIEQFEDREKEILISGDVKKDEFITINQRTETGITNNITQSKARFIVAKQDFRESIRLGALEMLSNMVTELSKSMPEAALAILDEVIDMMDDLQNKDEIVARIRKINRQSAPEDEMTPDEKEQFKTSQQRAMQEQEAVKQIQMAMAQAKLAIEQGKVMSEQTKILKDRVDAQMKKLDGFLKALQAAGTLAGSPALARAADILIKESEVAGGNDGNGEAKRRLISRGSVNPQVQ